MYQRCLHRPIYHRTIQRCHLPVSPGLACCCKSAVSSEILYPLLVTPPSFSSTQRFEFSALPFKTVLPFSHFLLPASRSPAGLGSLLSPQRPSSLLSIPQPFLLPTSNLELSHRSEFSRKVCMY